MGIVVFGNYHSSNTKENITKRSAAVPAAAAVMTVSQVRLHGKNRSYLPLKD
jgi:hypothetical protein